MKRLVAFVLLVVALDWAIGSTIAHFYRRTYTGERGGLTNYALTKDADILVLGSSRAQYQVMPAVLHERLSLTAFNAGLKGHDFMYSVMLYDLWRRRHGAPRAILLQMDIESLLDRPSELEAAQIFSPYLDESPLVREILYSASPSKRLAYLSRAYRFNGKAFSIAANLFSHQNFQFDGFLAATGVLKPGTSIMFANALDQDALAIDQARRPYSETKLRYLRLLSEQAARDQTLLVLFHTPLYQQDQAAHQLWMTRMKEAIGQMPIGVIDICAASHPELFANPQIYSDTNHINAEGAVLLSTILGNELRPRLAAMVDAGAARASQPLPHAND